MPERAFYRPPLKSIREKCPSLFSLLSAEELNLATVFEDDYAIADEAVFWASCELRFFLRRLRQTASDAARSDVEGEKVMDVAEARSHGSKDL